MVAKLVVDVQRDAGLATALQDRVTRGRTAGERLLYQDRARRHSHSLFDDLRPLRGCHHMQEVGTRCLEHLAEIREPALNLETVRI
jgi:hypothetical protein